MHSNGYSTRFVFVSTGYRAAYKQYRDMWMRLKEIFCAFTVFHEFGGCFIQKIRTTNEKDTHLAMAYLDQVDTPLRSKVTLGVLYMGFFLNTTS